MPQIPPHITVEFSIFAGLVFVNDEIEFTVGSPDLGQVRRALRDHCIGLAMAPIQPAPKIQCKILDRINDVWLDPDAHTADHPDGWLNFELRAQCGRGIL
jgi:hypothetical protein